MQQHLDLGGLPVEAVLLVADVLDGAADGALDLGGVESRAAHLAGHDHPVGGRQRLAGHPDLVGIDACLRAFVEEEIDDLVRDTVAHLVRVAFGHGLAGEQVAGARQATLLRRCGGEIDNRAAPAEKRRFCDSPRSSGQANSAVLFVMTNAGLD